MTEELYILKVIRRIRESFEDSVTVYSKGSCVKFAMILKEIFTEGIIYYNQDHAIFKYGERYFDINGYAVKTNHVPLDELSILEVYDILNLTYKKDGT